MHLELAYSRCEHWKQKHRQGKVFRGRRKKSFLILFRHCFPMWRKTAISTSISQHSYQGGKRERLQQGSPTTGLFATGRCSSTHTSGRHQSSQSFSIEWQAHEPATYINEAVHAHAFPSHKTIPAFPRPSPAWGRQPGKIGERWITALTFPNEKNRYYDIFKCKNKSKYLKVTIQRKYIHYSLIVLSCLSVSILQLAQIVHYFWNKIPKIH